MTVHRCDYNPECREYLVVLTAHRSEHMNQLARAEFIRLCETAGIPVNDEVRLSSGLWLYNVTLDSSDKLDRICRSAVVYSVEELKRLSPSARTHDITEAIDDGPAVIRDTGFKATTAIIDEPGGQGK